MARDKRCPYRKLCGQHASALTDNYIVNLSARGSLLRSPYATSSRTLGVLPRCVRIPRAAQRCIARCILQAAFGSRFDESESRSYRQHSYPEKLFIRRTTANKHFVYINIPLISISIDLIKKKNLMQIFIFSDFGKNLFT